MKEGRIRFHTDLAKKISEVIWKADGVCPCH